MDGFAGPAPAAEAEAPAAKPSHWVRKTLAVSLVGLTAVGVAGGVTAHVLNTAPVDPGLEAPIAIDWDGIRISPRAGDLGAGAWRNIRGTAYVGQAVSDLSSGQSRVLRPDGKYRPAAADRDGQFRVVSWNLHHGQSPGEAGSRDQVGEIIRQLRSKGAEVVLLQEVTPWQAQDYVNGTGLVGYYAQTTPTQGNMILVHPDLAVLDNAKLVLNADTDSTADAIQALAEYRAKPGDREPREAQALRLALPDGRTVMVWNTHLSTNNARPESRDAERARLVQFLEGQARPGEAILGGGDLNSLKDSPTLQALADQGFETQGNHIDWLATRNLGGLKTDSATIRDAAGQQVSDHVMVWGDATR